MTNEIPASLLDAYERGEIDEPEMLRYLIETGGLQLDAPTQPTLRYNPDLSTLGRLLHYVPAPPAQDEAAQSDLDTLLKLPPESRAPTIGRASKRYKSLELVELLLERSEEARTAHPPDALHFAELAQAVVFRCPACARTDDLHVLQLVHLGAATKACGDLDAAEKAFRTARTTLARHFAPDLHLLAHLDRPLELAVDPRRVIADLPDWLTRTYGVEFACGTTVLGHDLPHVVTTETGGQHAPNLSLLRPRDT